MLAHYAGDMPDLYIIRHGRSQWNELNLFTGWHDVDLVEEGEAEARAAGELLRGIDIRILHTSLLTRAIRTANIALLEAGRSWLPVQRTWRLNERHYGDLTGKDKKETAERFGMNQLMEWRRSYDVPPPPLPDDSPYSPKSDPRYQDLAPGTVPATECLKDVVARVRPYLQDTIKEDLLRVGAKGGSVLVVAHGNSIRALRMIIEEITPAHISELEVPTGIPFHYALDNELRVTESGYLGDPAAAAAAAEAVGRQAG
jgi:2,3-bisphosphoglycerate-dependent phosphoglycerate mutase